MIDALIVVTAYHFYGMTGAVVVTVGVIGLALAVAITNRE